MILNAKKTGAIVVSYSPEPIVLVKLLKTLLDCVDVLVLVDNGGGYESFLNVQEESGKIIYLNQNLNLGLGHALNVGFEYLCNCAVDYVATFDQDSDPDPKMIENLLSVHLELESRGINCAAVAPAFFDRRESEKKYFPFYKEYNGKIFSINVLTCDEKFIEVDSLITSGMLVKSSIWSNAKYDENLFVDYTDTEWCFRARSLGYKLYGCTEIDMGHAPSDSPPIRFLGLSFFNYSPLRRYYYYRNTILFCYHSYVSAAWRSRLIKGLILRFFINILIDKRKYKSISMMIRGLIHALIGKKGVLKL